MSMENFKELIESAQINFVSQNLDIVHLAMDKVVLQSRPYIDTITITPTAGEIKKVKTEISAGDIWVLSKIEHRDIEPGIFDVKILVDGLEIFPNTRLYNLQFLLPLAKAYVALKHIQFTVKNNDTIAKTYRVMRIWHIYNKNAVNNFLSKIGVPTIR